MALNFSADLLVFLWSCDADAMNALPTDIRHVAARAEWLAHRYDPGHDAFHFVKLSREDHSNATFLTDDHIAGHDKPVVIRRDDALRDAPPSAPVHFIFHSAYCCSTLLARALDIPGVSMGLKEPVILNDIIGWRHRGAEGRQAAMILDHSLNMLGRPFEPDEATIIKPSNLVNPLAAAMLSLRPDARALLLHAPLEAYLASIARKGMWGRLWVRDLMSKLLRERTIDLGFTPEDYLRLTDIQVAAVGWLVQHAHFIALHKQFGSRVATLNSEKLIEAPATALAALCRHFQLTVADDAIAEIAAGPVFRRNSKDGSEFERGQRKAEQESGLKLHREEIEMVAAWADTLAQNAGIAMALPAALTR